MKLLSFIPLAFMLLVGCQNPTDLSDTQTVMVSIPNMYCESCVAKTTEVLAKQSGVKDVKVDLEAKTATVAVDKSKFDGPTIIAVLDDYGFSDSKIVTEQKTIDRLPQ